MRNLMEQANMVPPTFESDHSANQFTTRLLLHHFLSEDDIIWLQGFNDYELTDAQKRALIFIREAGAIDNPTYRQLNGCDSLKASGELRNMRDLGLLAQKGKGRATYYVPDLGFNHPELGLSAPVPDLSAPVPDLSTPVDKELINQLPGSLQDMIMQLGKRTNNKEAFEDVIIALCGWKEMKISELSAVIGRSDKYLLREFITPMREAGKLSYTKPEMPNHPEQAYKAAEKTNL